MKCEQCASQMTLQVTEKYRYPNGKPRKVWRCTNTLWCTEERAAHPNGRPVGTRADEVTKQARQVAHNALEMLPKWQRYSWLARALNCPPEEAHIGQLGKDDCHRIVVLLCQEVGIL